MAKVNPTDKELLQQEKIEATVSKTEQFLNENKKTLIYSVCAALVVALCILAYTQWILKPQKAEAMAQMYPAEMAFARGEYELALNGDGNTLGFNEIISEYGSKAGKAVYLYAGVCELQAGNFQAAIDQLKKYSGKDEILAARALACIGDAYIGLEDYKTAVSYFEKAAAAADNMFAGSYLLKAGVTYEELGQNDKALACYKTIKDKYPQGVEGAEIDKYISRISK